MCLGLLPIIGQFNCCGKVLEPCQSIEDVKSIISEQKCIELVITGNVSLIVLLDFHARIWGFNSCISPVL